MSETYDVRDAELERTVDAAPEVATGDLPRASDPQEAELDHSDAGSAHRRPLWLTVLERYGLVILFAATVAFFATYGPSRDHYLSLPNIQNVLGNQCVVIVLAVAALFPLICGRFDLSIGANAGICSVAAAAVMSNYKQNLAVAVLFAVVLGCAIGAVIGFLVAYMKLSAIIVSLAFSTLISGVILAYAKGQIINLRISKSLTDFGSDSWLGIPKVAYLTGLLCFVAWFLLLHTAFGRYVHMAGRNPQAARLVGINVDKLTLICFALSGAIAGVAGVLMTARTAGANPASGPDLLFPALTATFLGATAIRPGELNIVGTVVAALFLAAAVSGMHIAGMPPYVEPLFSGAALIVAVIIYVTARRSAGGGSALAV